MQSITMGKKPMGIRGFAPLTVFLAGLAVGGCGAAPKVVKPVVLSPSELAVLKSRGGSLEYQRDIQPILDNRCSVCHSCYNSPCQLKLTSFEGVARGATKTRVYDGTRLADISPTRLFVDARTAEEWREKGFAAVIAGENGLGQDSFMYQLLDLKEQIPKVEGV